MNLLIKQNKDRFHAETDLCFARFQFRMYSTERSTAYTKYLSNIRGSKHSSSTPSPTIPVTPVITTFIVLVFQLI